MYEHKWEKWKGNDANNENMKKAIDCGEGCDIEKCSSFILNRAQYLVLIKDRKKTGGKRAMEMEEEFSLKYLCYKKNP